VLEPGGARNVKACEQFAPINGKRIGRPSLFDRRVECPYIALDVFRRNGEFTVAARHDRIRTERAAQEIDRLPEGVPRLLGVVFRPEEGKQGVPSLEAARDGQREITEEGGPPGLREYGPGGVPVGRGQLQGSQREQLDHASNSSERGEGAPPR
jgi:hypothetical protein